MPKTGFRWMAMAGCSLMTLAGCGSSSASSSVGAKLAINPEAGLLAAVKNTESAAGAKLEFSVHFQLAGVPGTPNTSVAQGGTGQVDPATGAARLDFAPSSNTGNVPLSIVFAGKTAYVNAPAFGGPAGDWVRITPNTKLPTGSAGPLQISASELVSASPIALLSIGKGVGSPKFENVALSTPHGVVKAVRYSGVVGPSGEKGISSLIGGIANLGGGSSGSAATTELLGVQARAVIWTYHHKVAKEQITLDFSKFFQQLLSALGSKTSSKKVKVVATIVMDLGPYQITTPVTVPPNSSLVGIPAG